MLNRYLVKNHLCKHLYVLHREGEGKLTSIGQQQKGQCSSGSVVPVYHVLIVGDGNNHGGLNKSCSQYKWADKCALQDANTRCRGDLTLFKNNCGRG